jgi:hypothetical protein
MKGGVGNNCNQSGHLTRAARFCQSILGIVGQSKNQNLVDLMNITFLTNMTFGTQIKTGPHLQNTKQCNIARVYINGKIQYRIFLHEVKYKWAHQTRKIREGTGEQNCWT